MKSRLAWVILLLVCMTGMLYVALLGFEQITTDAGVFNRIQAELDVYSCVGIGAEELEAVQEEVAYSLRTKFPLVNLEVIMFGVRQPVFNAREMAHMEDVIRLYRLERNVRNGTFTAFFGCILAMYIWIMRHGRRWLRSRLAAMTGFIALGVWLLAGLIFAAASGFDFDAAFVRFHEILFTNDLWQLDPATCAMIRMYPAEFFMAIGRDIGIRMALWAFGFAAAVFVAFYPWEGLRHGARACENPGD